MIRAVFAAATVLITAHMPVAAQAQQGYVWGYTPSIAASPLETYLGITYGVPQTDDSQFMGTCIVGMSGPLVRFNIVAFPGGREHGSTVSVQFNGQGFSRTLSGKVLNENVMVETVEIVIAPNDQFWQALISQNQLTYAIEGERSETLGLRGSARPVRQFTADCTNILSMSAPAGGGDGK